MVSHLLSVRYILFFLIVFSSNLGFSQDSLTSSSPSIIYGDFFLGGANLGGEGGFVYGIELCHQRKKHLLTFRYTVNPRRTIDGRSLVVFNNVTERMKTRETAFLYGFREVEKGGSWNASVGISINQHVKTDYTQNDPQVVSNYYYVGLPYEFSAKLFKAKKDNFGGSIGFKCFGNFSKKSYYGFGISFGLGVHRN